MEKDFIESLALEMPIAGYEIKRDWTIPNSKLTTSIYAKKGRFYFFVYDIECDLRGYLNDIVSVHRSASRYINSLYNFPKAFRLVIPTVTTVVVLQCGYDEDDLHWIRSEAVTDFFGSVIGGEANAIFLLDAEEKALIDLQWLDFNSLIPVQHAREMLQDLLQKMH